MADPQVLTTLRSKRVEIEKVIEGLTARLADARADLLHVAAVIRIFDPKSDDDKPATAYQGATKAMPRVKLFAHCKVALQASAEPLCTRELARYVITSEGWDIEDRRLRLTIAHKVGGMMSRYERRGVVLNVGSRDKATLWRLP